MPTLLQRYLAGDHLEAWNELRQLGSVTVQSPQFEDVWPVVVETMKRVRANLETLVERLRNDGYQFVDTSEPAIRRGVPLATPDGESLKFLRWLDDLTGPLPLVLRAWIEHVGDVCLLGHHPDWGGEGVFTDAMVVEFEYRQCVASMDAREYYEQEFEDWYDSGGEDEGRFEISFAPDALHKVNVSGGGPYGIMVPDDNVDGIVDINNRHMYFVDYLRECLRWGGFPGFANVTHALDRLRRLVLSAING